MSFEIKYDRDGAPIKNQVPEFKEVPAAASIEEVQSPELPTETMETGGDSIQEVEAAVVQESNEPEVLVASVTKEVTPQESWKIIRDRAKAAERRADELEQQLKEARGYKAQPQEELDFSIEDDALAEGKHLKKIQKQLAETQRQMKQYQQDAQLNNVRSSLKAQYPDWDNVFNQENLAKLEMLEPEIAYALNSATDPHKAGISAYKMIKRLGILEPEVNYDADKAIVQRNAAKPKAMASLNPQKGDSPLTKANAFANGLTDDLRKQMIKEMQEARRGY